MLNDLEELLSCPGDASEAASSSAAREGAAAGAELGGFAVADAARYDHFPGSRGHVGGALLLLRRPGPCLVLPVGPVGSGKSELCRRLQSAVSHKSCTVVERDHVLASLRSCGRGPGCETGTGDGGALSARGGGGGTAAPLGLGAAKRQTHQICVERLQRAARAHHVCVFDSCNASAAGRMHYAEMVRPELLLMVSFEPPRSSGAVATTDSCEGDHRDMLLARARSRTCHPTFPPAREPERQAAALDATIAAMEWPAAESRVDLSSDLAATSVIAGAHGACRRVKVHRCSPSASAEVNCASVIDQLVAHFLWLLESEGLCREHWLRRHAPHDDPQTRGSAGDGVRLEIAYEASDSLAVGVAAPRDGGSQVRLRIMRQ
jgi:hypothetical protein